MKQESFAFRRERFNNPGMKLSRGTYFATLKVRNGDNDKTSELDREGIFRLNMGITPQAFEEYFSSRPARPHKGGIITGNYDFTKLDSFTPHPIYGWLYWITILNPSQKSFDDCKKNLDIAYSKALKLTQKKINKL